MRLQLCFLLLTFSVPAQVPVRSSSRQYVQVDLDQPPSAQVRAQLAASGIRLLEPVAPGRYWASVDPAGELSPASRYRFVLRASVPDPEDKLSEDLRGGRSPIWARSGTPSAPSVDVDAAVFEDFDLSATAAPLARLGATVLDSNDYFRRIRLRVPLTAVRTLAALNWVMTVESIPAPFRTFSNAASASLLKADALYAGPYQLSGQGVRAGIVDGGAVDAHTEFRDRLTVVDRASASAHATHVAGTLAASGSTNPALKGLAPGALLFSYTFSGDVAAKMLSARRNERVDLTSNSWGGYIADALGNCNTEGGYGTLERDLDRLVLNEKLPVVMAMGNDRNDDKCAIGPRGGFYTTSRPASAKNVIAVGAVDSSEAVSAFSGYGPARDGRLKPDLTALGVKVLSTSLKSATAEMSGTSMSTPAVSGLLALLIERFRSASFISPSADLLKAILLNTATDLGNPGPDYTFGYGLPHAERAVEVIDNSRYAAGRLAQGDSRTHEIDVPAGTKSLRVLIAWSDAPAVAGATRTLVNDLDLSVSSPSGVAVLPLTLNPDNPGAPAQPARNTRDNVEQVVVQVPDPGRWTIRVSGAVISTENQDYSVTWSFADSPVPPCTLTVSPEELILKAEGGTSSLAVTQSTACSPWKPEVLDYWLQLVPATERPVTGVVKVRYDANGGPSRDSGVMVNKVRIPVRQNAACAEAPYPLGESVPGELTAKDCVTNWNTYARHYTFDARAGQGVRINLDSAVFDAYLELRLADGSIIAENDDGGGGTNSQIPAGNGFFILPFTGRYTIEVSSLEQLTTGPYRLSVSLVDNPGDPSAAVPVTACPAEFNSTLGERSSRAGYRGDLFATDRYLFYGRLGSSISAEIPDASFDTVLYLIGGDRRVLAFNDDADGVAGSRVRATLPATGVWSIEVSSFAPSTGGSYRLTVNGCQSPPQ
ncbi:MAG: S8 family serine peptidase [Candidatus Solibacter usitatus]|nr:S8 family serine peptidase [Candidatus Solibacter usitatus]